LYFQAGLVYPKIAQSKGSSDRSTSKDLRWEWSSTLSSPPPITRRSSIMERLSMKSSMVGFPTHVAKYDIHAKVDNSQHIIHYSFCCRLLQRCRIYGFHQPEIETDYARGATDVPKYLGDAFLRSSVLSLRPSAPLHPHTGRIFSRQQG
jgi:hypothetical protein